MSMIALLVLTGFAFYVMNGQERRRVVRPVLGLMRLTGRSLARGARGSKWLVVGVLSGNAWAVTGVVLAAVLALNFHIPAAGWKTLTDVRPDIERLIATEENTARIYDAAVAQFRRGVLTADGLATTITTSVMPELEAIADRLRALNQTRTDHRALLMQAEEYVRLRSESWRLRIDALQTRSLATLKTADRVERLSLDALARVRPN
jgi:hypothetical protein